MGGGGDGGEEGWRGRGGVEGRGGGGRLRGGGAVEGRGWWRVERVGVSSRGAWQWVGGGWVETEGDGSDAFITMISSG